MTSGILVADLAWSEQGFDDPHAEAGHGRWAAGMTRPGDGTLRTTDMCCA
jgi:hypothetical protein